MIGMDTQQKGWNGFLELCLKAKDKKSLSVLLELFLTHEEQTDLAMRYLIVKDLLKEEKTQREIAKDLNVSIAKITRGSNELKRLNEKLRAFLQQQFLAKK